MEPWSHTPTYRLLMAFRPDTRMSLVMSDGGFAAVQYARGDVEGVDRQSHIHSRDAKDAPVYCCSAWWWWWWGVVVGGGGGGWW
jgi:hypothetical protein